MCLLNITHFWPLLIKKKKETISTIAYFSWTLKFSKSRCYFSLWRIKPNQLSHFFPKSHYHNQLLQKPTTTFRNHSLRLESHCFKEVKYIPIHAVLVKFTVPAVKLALVLLYNVKIKNKNGCTGLYRLYFGFDISVSTGTIKKC